MSKTGIDYIKEERDEQLEKHGFDAAHDDSPEHSNGELAQAAIFLLTGGASPFPVTWTDKYKTKFEGKNYRESLIIAGALVAAEIDRIDRKGVVDAI